MFMDDTPTGGAGERVTEILGVNSFGFGVICFGMKQVRQNGMNVVSLDTMSQDVKILNKMYLTGASESHSRPGPSDKGKGSATHAGVFPSGSQASLRPKKELQILYQCACSTRNIFRILVTKFRVSGIAQCPIA